MRRFRLRALSIAVSAPLAGSGLFPTFARGQIYLASASSTINEKGNIAEYTTLGAPVNTPLVSGFSAFNLGWIALSGSDLFVTNGNTIGEYNTSGGTVQSSLISGLGGPQGIAISGTDMFVANSTANTIGEYNTSGGKLSASLITGLDDPEGIAISGSTLFVANYGNNTIGEYNTSGGKINASFISTGLNGPYGIALSGPYLLVANFNNGTVGEYNASSGGLVTSSFVSGLNNPYGIAVLGTNLYVADYEGQSLNEYNASSGAKVNVPLTTGLDLPAGIVAQSQDYYFTGASSGAWSTPANFSSAHSGGTAWTLAPNFINNVFLTADSAVNFASQILNGSYTINALSFTGGSTSGATTPITLANGSGGTLTLAAGYAFMDSSGNTYASGIGLVVQANSAGGSITAPILLENSQTWEIDNSSAKSITVSGGIGDGGAGLSLTKTGAGSLILGGLNTYTGGTNASIGTLTFASPGALPNFSALTVDSTAIVMNHSGGTKNTLFTSSLTIAGSTGAWTGKLDLGNNDLVVQNGSLPTITNQIKQGYSNGAWNGSGGIVSSAAAGNSAHLTALGAILNIANGTSPLYGSSNPFDGATAQAVTDVLVKYTYYGDANLSGSVDGSDYSLIDSTNLKEHFVNGAPQTAISGWYNGDFNYDGVVNGSDYTLIDNAFNTQSGPITDVLAAQTEQIAEASGESPVPEPAIAVLLGIGATSLLGRSRRR